VETLRGAIERLKGAVQKGRLVDTALKLIAARSPTGDAGEAADCLAGILREDGFSVERPDGGHPRAPAVAVRFGKGGRTLQFNGHLDTVHLPFVPPRIDGGRITGSGAADMKSGLAAAVEAVRALRDSDLLDREGSVLLTAHDLHEAPWGFGQQLDRLIRDGWVGHGVLIPEPLSDRLPVIGRGAAVWKAAVHRPGPPVHEVMRPAAEPSVIGAGAEMVAQLARLEERLATRVAAHGERESVFVGQIHSGEIYNQYPQVCTLEGTRRWLPDAEKEAVEREFRDLAAELERDTGTRIDLEYRCVRDAFALDEGDPLVSAFQGACEMLSGRPLAPGPKPFVDDGNSFWSLGRVPAITHGPQAAGQHTTNEWASIDALERVARLYALTAVAYCAAPER
jgi:acetylornithine deacetylase/succinyl-diaminopimelate desuccinylase-like protein